MIIKIQEAIAFENFAQKVLVLKAPLEISYKIAKIRKQLQDDIEFYNSEFEKILKEFGQKNDDETYKFSEDGTMILIDPDRIEECQESVNRLQNMEIKVDIEPYLLKIEDFKSVEIDGIDMLNLIVFFE